MELIDLAVDTCFWSLYEVIDGKYKLNYKPKNKLSITEWLKTQGRLKHLFKPENANMLEMAQAEVDKRWEQLLMLCFLCESIH